MRSKTLPHSRRSIAALIMVVALGGFSAWYLWQGQTSNSRWLKASGTLEADEVAVSPEVGGRITELLVKEGERVTKGQTVAQLRMLVLQRDKISLESPIDGWVITAPFHAGEVATPGSAVVTVADLQELKLTVYIREDKIGHIKVGQEARVVVDSFSGTEFRGQVIHIASKIEFTPKNIQTTEDRVSTVFAVKLRLSNPDLKLKPGMFADAYFDLKS